ncbi:type VII toxin-antitoxin system HepT family RNase toxin [Marinomonas sp.]|uniref:type VII toxin-antitoxin system HepT family RNase toxin n=1 Tax=Marinomonas sp. TaxID=1904862 RepID=UPI003BAD6A83
MNTPKAELDYEPYVMALNEQVEQHLSGLDELSAITHQRPLTFNERSATERSLQVIVEVAIGCSKHYLKSQGKPVPSEARASIERVFECLAITQPDIKDMRGAIGMRNAIIHDYLNLDWSKLDAVLKNKKYHLIDRYIQCVMSNLLSI